MKVGGYFVALKGSRAAEELAEVGGIPEKLGLGAPQVIPYALPGGDGRALVIYEKVRPTPTAYPRSFGKIKKGE